MIGIIVIVVTIAVVIVMMIVVPIHVVVVTIHVATRQRHNGGYHEPNEHGRNHYPAFHEGLPG
jgi:hypothetical protein